uniref:Trophoblast glycoprotein n=1 Tax=Chelonoidis abingdonii TaxID=106734 RepID=A0A8C0H6D9_CHEAB
DATVKRRAALGLLLQVLLGWGSAQQPGSCPAPCECSEAARTVKCVNRNLTAVPPDLPPYARLLFLTGNRLSSLPPCAGAFASLPSLRQLDLSGNALTSLQAATFHSLAQLQSLDLSHNSLKCLKNATITQLRSRPALRRISLGHNTWVCDCCIEHLVSWLKGSEQVEGKGALKCSYPDKMRDKPLVKTSSSDLDCSVPVDIQSQLQTSYVFLGIVLALIGAIFLLVLYLNRKGIKKWMYNIRDACRDHMEGYHYRYEVNADPRLTNLSSKTTDLFVPCGEYACM